MSEADVINKTEPKDGQDPAIVDDSKYKKRRMRLIIDTDSMVKFFEADPTLGTKPNPYVADSFCTMDSPNTSWRSGGILQLEPKSRYVIQLEESLEGHEITTLDHNHEGGGIRDCFELKMIRNTDVYPDGGWEKEWEKAFVLNGKDELGRPLYVVNEETLRIYEKNDNAFVIRTQDKISLECNLVYKIFFHVDVEVTKENKEWEVKYGVIDPYIHVPILE